MNRCDVRDPGRHVEWKKTSLDSGAFGALLGVVFVMVVGLFASIAWPDPDSGTSATAATPGPTTLAALPR